MLGRRVGGHENFIVVRVRRPNLFGNLYHNLAHQFSWDVFLSNSHVPVIGTTNEAMRYHDGGFGIHMPASFYQTTPFKQLRSWLHGVSHVLAVADVNRIISYYTIGKEMTSRQMHPLEMIRNEQKAKGLIFEDTNREAVCLPWAVASPQDYCLRTFAK
jgi:hypothetical protein